MPAPALADDDERMLLALLDASPDPDEEVRFDFRAFEGMLSRGKALTDKQRNYLRDVFERIVGTPQYENLWSAGKVPRGESFATPVPEVLLKPLPKKPPGRK